MKKIISTISLVVILMLFSSCNVLKEDFHGDNNLEEKIINDVSSDNIYSLSVKKIQLNNKTIKVNFLESDKPSVTVKTDKNILDTLDISIKGNTITIVGENKYEYYVNDFVIEIALLKLDKFELQGAFSFNDVTSNFASSLEIISEGVIEGDIDLRNVTDNLKFVSNGVSSVSFLNVSAELIDIKINGTSNFKAIGTTKELRVDGNGIVNLNLIDLFTETSIVLLDGTISASLRVSNKLEINANGLGNVEYYGNPTTIEIKKDGLVMVNKK